MKFSAFSSTIAALVVAIPLVAAAEGPYVGAGYSKMRYDDEDPDTDVQVEPEAATVRLGVEANDVFGIEARGGTGFSSDTENGVEVDLDHLYGGYVKLSAPTEAVRPYVIGGYTKTKTTYKASFGPFTGTERETEEDESWGAGVDVGLGEDVALNLEYMRYLDKDNFELSGVTIGIRSAF